FSSSQIALYPSMAESAGGGEPRLPEELVLWEILTRLPARSLLRCRAVCTSWRRSLTSDTGLLLAHHRHQPALQLVTTGDDLEGRIDALDPRAGERRPVARTDRAASPMDLVLLAACYIGMARLRSKIANPRSGSMSVSSWYSFINHFPSFQMLMLRHICFMNS
uniref:F-box domain-containing protein n=1 Tax=Aegilops tauschii subsp. strangulata TaxID=200361 RepID=A0A453ADK4_AEGTS